MRSGAFALLAVAVLAVACGGSGEAETTVSTSIEPTTAATGGSSTPVTQTASSPTTIPIYPTTTELLTLTPPTVSSTTSIPIVEPDETLESLTEDQQQIVGFICEQASIRNGSLADMWILMVISGDSGVADLEEAWNEIGEGAEKAELLAAAAPICEQIGLTP